MRRRDWCRGPPALGVHMPGGGIFAMRTSLAVGGSLGQVLVWPLISRCASSCGLFLPQQGSIISNG